MTTARIRSVLSATAAAAVLSYSLSGHGLPQLDSHDGMAGATAGLCLLLATVLVYVAAPTPAVRTVFVATHGSPARSSAPPLPPLDGRARASPAALQRFRN